MSPTTAAPTAIPLEAPRLGEPYLLTPGPLTTAYSVKEAMLRDWGSWDGDFRAMTAELRRHLLEIAGDVDGEFDCVPIQGSGSFSGGDGPCTRISQTLTYLGRAHVDIDKGDYMPPRGHEVAAALEADPEITHVVVVHCETSSGILNPLKEISETVYAHGRKLLVDSMSAFGAVPAGIADFRYEAIVSSANKCIEGVPGFGFVLARKSALEEARGNSHSLSLDIHAQWDHMNKTGQWRFTPPTHVVAAFLEALRIHREEGGIAARGGRYARNRDVMVAGMRGLGFETLLADQWLSPVIVTFFSPAHPAFAFDRFYALMKEKGFIIYPGKLTVVDSFRIGCIGRMDEHVMRRVVEAARNSLAEMGVDTAAPPAIALEERSRLAA